MLKGNVPLDKDFTSAKSPTPKAKQKKKVAEGLTLIQVFEAEDATQEVPPGIRAAVLSHKHSPFDELYYELIERIQASGDIELLQAIACLMNERSKPPEASL